VKSYNKSCVRMLSVTGQMFIGNKNIPINFEEREAHKMYSQCYCFASLAVLKAA
jgi:hypothetical protein